jgi:hypothetical protein
MVSCVMGSLAHVGSGRSILLARKNIPVAELGARSVRIEKYAEIAVDCTYSWGCCFPQGATGSEHDFKKSMSKESRLSI